MLCYLTENEELMKKVNSNVLSLIEYMTRSLACKQAEKKI